GLVDTINKASGAVQKYGDTMTGNLWLSEAGISIRTISGDSPQFSINNIASGADVNIDLLGAEARIFGKGSGSGPVKVATFNLNNGTFSVPGPLKAGTSELHTDGNVYGDMWGGWLSNWLNTKLNERATVDWASQNFATYSWTTQNFVQEVSLGAEVFYDQTGGIFTWTFKSPQGCTMTGLMARYTGSNSAHNIGGLYYKPIQRFKNGIWVTISG
ncbi:hypothetical protein OGW16_00855, partial [Citrobacter sp. Ce104]|nr:hypothetical protein [Citrobacter sp. Ce104]